MPIKSFVKKNINRINHWKNTVTDLKPKLLALLYHRVLPEYKKNKLNVVVSRAAFEKQLDQLSQRYRILSMKDAASRSGGDKIRIVLTFDDGYWDNYEIVFPILKKKGIPATFFLVTDYIDGKAQFSDRRLMDKKTGQPGEFIKDRFITWGQAREMREVGMEIGSHGLSHRSLSQMTLDDAKREILDSKRIIEEKTGVACRQFSFPFGSRSDYNDELINCVKEAGYDSCLLNIHGYNHADSGDFCFKRIVMSEDTDIGYLLG